MRRVRPVVGGGLVLLVGLGCMFGAYVGLIGGGDLVPLAYPDDFPELGVIWQTLAVFLSAPFGTAAVLAGTAAIRRKHWDLAFVGSILGAVGGALVFPLFGGVIGIVGVILVGISRDEFE